MKERGLLLVLTPESRNNENFKHCISGEKAQLPMYCLISDNQEMGIFKQFNWRKVMRFTSEKEFDECVKEIRKDLKWFHSIGV